MDTIKEEPKIKKQKNYNYLTKGLPEEDSPLEEICGEGPMLEEDIKYQYKKSSVSKPYSEEKPFNDISQYDLAKLAKVFL